MVVTTTKECVIGQVPNRTRDQLLPIIQEYVLPGSIIWSDTWRPYFCLSDYGYNHQMVNHSEEFVRNDGVHTQEIESLWNSIKCELKIRRGYNAQQLSGYLDEFMFRRGFVNDDIFDKLLEHIAIQYPV